MLIWPGNEQKKPYFSAGSSLDTSIFSESVSPAPMILVCAMMRASPSFRYCLSIPPAMPSVAIGCMSASLLITRLWPMTFFGRLPECSRLTVNSLQLLSISMALVLNDIWSVESTVTEHSAANKWPLARVSRDAATSLRIMMSLLNGVALCFFVYKDCPNFKQFFNYYYETCLDGLYQSHRDNQTADDTVSS